MEATGGALARAVSARRGASCSRAWSVPSGSQEPSWEPPEGKATPLGRDAQRSRRNEAIRAYRKNCQANHPTNAKAAIMVTIAATVTTLSQMGPIGHDETSGLWASLNRAVEFFR